MALYEVTLTQSFHGVECVNRFNYQLTGTPAAVLGSYALVSAFGAIYDTGGGGYPSGSLIQKISDIQGNDVTFTGITAKNLYSVTDFYSTPFQPALTGGNASESLSPINAYGFYSSRVRTDVRRGSKRFVGVGIDRVSAGGLLDSSGIAGCTALATALGATLTYNDEGNTLSFAPCVLSKERYTVPGSDPARYAYRYYSTETAQLSHAAVGILWTYYAQVRSQTSRQYGRGN